MFPHGIEEICEVYGDPYTLMGENGILDPPERAEWESRLTLVPFPEPVKLSYAPLQKASKVRVHTIAAEAYASVFRTLYAERDLWAAIKTYGGSYNFRPKSSGVDLSTHSWGLAIDLNVATNQRGTPGDMHPRIVQVFEAHGFVWGGRWRGRQCDPMHFQACAGY